MAAAIDWMREGAFQATGRVATLGEGFLEVRCEDATFRARRAFSCLVAPEPGDRVWVAGSHAGDVYVLAVLERPGSADARITGEGNLTLELRSGRLCLAATQGVDLVSRETVSVTSQRIEARAHEGHLFVGRLLMIGEALDATLERISQTVRRCYRRVRDLDSLRAGQIDYASQGNLRLHGENTLMTARQLVKADGEQIHIG